MTALHNHDQYAPEAPTIVAAKEAPEFDPISGLMRAMRGRWAVWLGLSVTLGGALAVVGFLAGTATYESSAILRVYPREPSVLYASRDDSVLKTYESYVKAETTFVASHPVMARALENLQQRHPDLAMDITPEELASSIEIRRAETLIVLKTKSRVDTFAAAKLDAVTAAYLALTEENEASQANARSEELTAREAELAARLRGIGDELLRIGGEFGSDALARAHIEKIAQIDALSARRSEIEATLAALTRGNGASSADMNDQEIMRATLLDRALADLNFEKAKLESDLATLRTRYRDGTRQVRDQLQRIAVIDAAMADRRTQIQVLGQTGALTDQSGAAAEDSVADIADLLGKITDRLETARQEARDLNARRIEMGYLEAEREELRRMLEETRAALDEIAVESDNALPGLVDLMVPATVPVEPAEDSTKMLAAGGFLGGGVLGTLIMAALMLGDGRMRFSDATWKYSHLVPTIAAFPRGAARDPESFARRIDRLRNRIMLMPARASAVSPSGHVIAVGRMGEGSSSELSRALAESFARGQARVLLVDGDAAMGTLTTDAHLEGQPGWADCLTGQPADAKPTGPVDLLPIGRRAPGTDQGVALRAVREALRDLANAYDVVIVEVGSLRDTLSAELILSAADFAVGVTTPRDLRRDVLPRVELLDALPRNGGALVMASARRRDPALA